MLRFLKLGVNKNNMLLTIAIVLSSPCYSQAVYFKIKAGSNISNIRSGGGSTRAGYRLGFHCGGLALVKLSSRVALQPEISYSTQGRKYSSTFSNSTTILNYINLPVLFQLKLGTGFRLQAGPQIGFLIAAKVKRDGQVYDLDIKRSYRLVDIAYSGGLCYLNQSRIGVDVRWVRSLIPITLGPHEQNNNVFQLGLFYDISKGHNSKQ